MMKAIPMTMPMTHLVTHEGRRMEGIARYPLDSWEAAGDPCFTTEKWGMLCMLLSEKGLDIPNLSQRDREVFEQLFTVATRVKDGWDGKGK